MQGILIFKSSMRILKFIRKWTWRRDSCFKIFWFSCYQRLEFKLSGKKRTFQKFYSNAHLGVFFSKISTGEADVSWTECLRFRLVTCTWLLIWKKSFKKCTVNFTEKRHALQFVLEKCQNVMQSFLMNLSQSFSFAERKINFPNLSVVVWKKL